MAAKKKAVKKKAVKKKAVKKKAVKKKAVKKKAVKKKAVKKKAVKKVTPARRAGLLSKDQLRARIAAKQFGFTDESHGWSSQQELFNGRVMSREYGKFVGSRKAFWDAGRRGSIPSLTQAEWNRLIWAWARRMRRDTLALEEQLRTLASKTNFSVVFFDDPGDPPPPPDGEDGFR